MLIVVLIGAAVRLLIVRFNRSFNKCNKIRVIINKFCYVFFAGSLRPFLSCLRINVAFSLGVVTPKPLV